ncbi:GGDEF domain-containing protein [Achromobacter aloeverae]|uniref:diguanylate cyclase n=1 Tax=Achromobacter aloeverae TaxID=1750518 RepID=A0A4V1MSL9_9BURK|nr:GGDEF domain-containing protein [Achromobacter aloeverae]RXN92500.1 hypothetical protein C7R54_01725 [Achromobacter aloeverae]
MPAPALLLGTSALVSLLMGRVLWSLAHNDVPGCKVSVLSTLLLCASMVMIAAQPWLPPFIGIVVANVMVGAAAALYYAGVRLFFGRPVPVAALVAAVALLAVGIVLFWYVWRDLPVRVVFVSGVLSGLACATAATILRYRPLHRPRYPYLLALGMSMLVAVVHALRFTTYLLRLDPIGSMSQSSGFQTIYLSVGLFTMPGMVFAMVLMAYDRMLTQRETEAHTDDLTGVLSRKAWWLVAHKTVARGARGGQPFSLLVLSIDRLRHINQTFGTQSADAVLRHFSRLAADVLPDQTLIGRIEGKIFAALFPDTRRDAALLASEALSKAVGGDACKEGVWSISYTFSAGLAEWDGQESAQALFERASQALSAARNAGRGHIKTHH